MKGYGFMLLLVHFFIINFSCRNIETTSFSAEAVCAKYSYPIIVFADSNNIVEGTGFFYREHEKVWFLTNYHLTGMNPFTKKIEYNSSFAYIFYPRNDRQGFGNLKISLKPYLSMSPFSFIENVDLLKIEVPDVPQDIRLFFINDMIDTVSDSMLPISLHSFSTSLNLSNDAQEEVAKRNEYVGKWVSRFSEFEKMSSRQSHTETMFAEPLVHEFEKRYFLTIPAIEPGFSGSPIFAKMKYGKEFRYVFWGMFFGYNKKQNFSWAIRKEIIYKSKFIDSELPEKATMKRGGGMKLTK